MIESRLRELCPYPLSITWHENRRSYLTFRKSRSAITLRLHRLFLHAPSPVHEALIRFLLKKDPEAKVILRQMAHLYFSKHRSEPLPLSPHGKVYDLQGIYDDLKNRFFPLNYNASIGWSTPPRKSRFRHMTFGAYDQHRCQIRIHPYLDDAEVPLYFLQFVVYHEMLHGLCEPILDTRGACRCHTAEFRKLEKRFPDYERAKEWERKSLSFFKRNHGRP